MCGAGSNLVLQSKYVLRIWCNGTGFAFKHYLPDYLPLALVPALWCRTAYNVMHFTLSLIM